MPHTLSSEVSPRPSYSHALALGALSRALSADEARAVHFISGLRCIAAILLCLFLDRIYDLGTSPWVIAGGTALGVLTASQVAFGPLSSRNALLRIGIGVALYRAAWMVAHSLPLERLMSPLSIAAAELHLNIIGLGFLFGLTSTWLFWRTTHALTTEIIGLLLIAVGLFAAHRGLRLDQPELVHALAWRLGWSPVSTLVAVGVAITALTVLLLLISSSPGRPLGHRSVDGARVHTQVVRNKKRSLGGSLMLVILSAGVLLVGYLTHTIFSRLASGSVTAMGVGQETKEELSPLGFHSSLGKNSQPSALVRLEGDYAENPFTPMLYLRESALSGFNGKEMVIASARYDTDVNRTRPDEAFSTEPDTRLLSRTPLEQSVFLLAEHKTAFAIDFPIEIRQIKNPNPDRFNAAYKAYSVAPGFSLSDLSADHVGDPNWDQDTVAHYTAPHPDSRYRALALQIVGDVSNPIAQAFLINQWFSANAIYTLTPGHEVAPDGDPVAPFLFGDMRGYCVHFAHAMVYLYRSLGIPARIGTGYLTDLSQAKDGHILLRMNDRHAWSEVYISERGWIPFDPQPQQVENHGESPVDLKLLEELMGMIGPSEDILPSDVAKDEASQQIEPALTLPEPRTILGIAALLIFSFVALKLYLLYGWRLVPSPSQKTALRYRARQAVLLDLGLSRDLGETRAEFDSRLKAQFGRDLLPDTSALLRYHYQGTTSQTSPAPMAPSLFGSLPFPWWRKLLGILSPRATLAFLLRRPW